METPTSGGSPPLPTLIISAIRTPSRGLGRLRVWGRKNRYLGSGGRLTESIRQGRGGGARSNRQGGDPRDSAAGAELKEEESISMTPGEGIRELPGFGWIAPLRWSLVGCPDVVDVDRIENGRGPWMTSRLEERSWENGGLRLHGF